MPFRTLVRDARKGGPLGCDFVVGDIDVGDFDDPPSAAEAMTGVDRLFLNAGGAVPTPGEQPMIRRQKTAIDAEYAEYAEYAAYAAGVRHIVKISEDLSRPPFTVGGAVRTPFVRFAAGLSEG